MSTSAIHDIGYRGYDGRRLGRGYILRSLFTYSLRSVYGLGRPVKSKVLPFALFAAMTLPALASVAALAAFKEPEALIPYAGYAVYLQPLVAIFVASQAPVVASRDLRFHVVPLYFSRPPSGFDYVLAKFAAFTTALTVLLATPVLILYAGAAMTRQPDLGRHTTDAAAALGGVLVFSLVLAGMGLVIASYAPRRGFGVAAVMAVYLISFAATSVVQGIASINGNDDAVGWAGLATPFYLVDGIQVWALGAAPATPEPPPPGAAGWVFAGTAAAIVLLSVAGMFLRFRKAGG